MTQSRSTPSRRPYDNTLRLERAAQTRERMVSAATELLHDSSIRDWRGITIRSVAERAGVNERTVFRHFANERALRDAVMHRLEQEAGVDLSELRLERIADATARILRVVAGYPSRPPPDLDATLADANRRQHEALLGAIQEPARDWPDGDRILAAAMFDVLWAVSSYERLVVDWHLDPDDAIRGLQWVVELVQEAISAGRRPGWKA